MTATDRQSIAALPDQQDREAVANLLFAAGAAFDEFTSQMRRGLELNAHERLAISALWARGPMSMTDLGTWIPLSRAAVTTLVDRLEDAGLVVRSADAIDRRRTVVTVTDVALNRMRPLIVPWSKALFDLVQERTAEEWNVIGAFLAEYTAMNGAQSDRLAAMSDEEIQKATLIDAPHEGP